MIENKHNEFKRALNDKFEKEVVALLNSKDGGSIYVRIDDEGKIIGIDNVDKKQLEIKDRIKHNISPSTLGLFDVIAEKRDGVNIIHVFVASGPEKPYYLRKKGMSPEGSFIRVGSSVEPINKEMIIDLFTKRTKNSLRNIASPNQNLIFSQLKIYYEELGYEIGSNFLQQLELVNDDGSYNYVAYLLSDNNSVSIQVAKYSGIDTFNLVESEEFGHCSLIKATKNVLNKLELENKTFTKITHVERKEIKMVEPIALREAVINAIVHNDYTYEQAAKFEIFDDRIEISSNGGLPERFTKEDFLGGFSAPKNKELMRVFKDIGLVEQLGTGIRRILKYYNEDVYDIYPNFIKVSFKYRNKEDIALKNKHAHNLNEVQRDIISIVLNNPNVTQELIALELSISKRTVIRHMNTLVNMGVLKRVGGNRTGYWLVTKIE